MRVAGSVSIAFLALAAGSTWSHPMMGAITWNRQVSRIVYAHCVSCHRDGGTAFPLLDYAQARGAAEAIKATVLARTMPPWGAVKGFGELRDEAALAAAQVDMLVEWVESGAPRGNNARALPEEPAPAAPSDAFVAPSNAIAVSGDTELERATRIAGLLPRDIAPDASLQIVAVLPDGSVRPLVWLYQYGRDYRHAFWFARALDLPRGTVIRGVPADATVLLIPDRGTRGSGA